MQPANGARRSGSTPQMPGAGGRDDEDEVAEEDDDVVEEDAPPSTNSALVGARFSSLSKFTSPSPFQCLDNTSASCSIANSIGSFSTSIFPV